MSIEQFKIYKKGFTLLEVTIAAVLIAVLFTVVYIAVKPASRIGETNNALRLQDTKAIEHAIKSALLASSTSPVSIINIPAGTYYSLTIDGANTSGTYECSILDSPLINRYDIASTTEAYLGGSFPIDPDESGARDTGYYLLRTGNLFDVGYCNWYTETVEEEAPAGPTCGDGELEAPEVCDYDIWTVDCIGAFNQVDYTISDVGAGANCNIDCTEAYTFPCEINL